MPSASFMKFYHFSTVPATVATPLPGLLCGCVGTAIIAGELFSATSSQCYAGAAMQICKTLCVSHIHTALLLLRLATFSTSATLPPSATLCHPFPLGDWFCVHKLAYV